MEGEERFGRKHIFNRGGGQMGNILTSSIRGNACDPGSWELRKGWIFGQRYRCGSYQSLGNDYKCDWIVLTTEVWKQKCGRELPRY